MRIVIIILILPGVMIVWRIALINRIRTTAMIALKLVALRTGSQNLRHKSMGYWYCVF